MTRGDGDGDTVGVSTAVVGKGVRDTVKLPEGDPVEVKTPVVGRPLTLPVGLQDPSAVVARGEGDRVEDTESVKKPVVGAGEGVIVTVTDPLGDKLRVTVLRAVEGPGVGVTVTVSVDTHVVGIAVGESVPVTDTVTVKLWVSEAKPVVGNPDGERDVEEQGEYEKEGDEDGLGDPELESDAPPATEKHRNNTKSISSGRKGL